MLAILMILASLSVDLEILSQGTTKHRCNNVRVLHLAETISQYIEHVGLREQNTSLPKLARDYVGAVKRDQ